MKDIFKAYDIRGIVPKELDDGVAYLLGRAFASHTKAKTILVGFDMRPSGVSLKAALIKGLCDQGADVVDIGLCSTPMFYFATKDYDAGIMVTASHNPKEYNGFKMCAKNASPIGEGSGMEEIKQRVLNQEFEQITNSKQGVVTSKNILSNYISFSKKFLTTNAPFTVVVDCANGMGGHTYTELAKQLPHITFIPLYWELDGNFPNHEANPLKYETLRVLQETIRKEKADLGIAIDGDGDRIMFVDEKGEVIPAAIIGTLIAKELLQNQQKQEARNENNKTKGVIHETKTTKIENQPKIVYGLQASKILAQTVDKYDGIAIESRVGHAFIKKRMREEDALFGVEISGHMYHKEMEYTENEIIPLCRVLNILFEESKHLSECVAPFRVYESIQETNFVVKDTQQKIREVEAAFKSEAKRSTHIDGLKMECGNWWFSLRASNTEPLLRLNVEADTKDILVKKVHEIEKIIGA